MTRGFGAWNEKAIEEKKNVDMNGYNRHANLEMSSATSENFNSLFRRISNERERDQRLQACSDLRRLLLEANDFKALNREPFSVVRQFDELIHTRMNIDVRREIAKCLGAMGYIMSHKTKDFLIWLFDNYERTTVAEAKTLYMVALGATFASDCGRRRLEKVTGKTLSDLQKVLESVELPQTLIATLDAIVLIAAAYPELFSSYFKDIVDIVVGWYVDTEQEDSTLTKCGEALSKLQPFWLNDMGYTLSLLTNFLEDAETYIEDTRSNSTKKRSESLTPHDCLRKSSALIKAFKTILSAISEYFIVTMDNTAYCHFVEDAVAKLTYCIESCAGKFMAGFSSLVESSVDSLKLLLDVCRMQPEMVLTPAASTCSKLVETGDLEVNSALALIALVRKVISKLPSDLVAKYVASFIGPNGCIYKMRSHHDQQVVREALDAYKLLLAPRGVKCLQEVYRYILGELVCCLKVMHLASNSADTLSLPDIPDGSPWPDDACDYSPVLAEAIVVYLSSALVDLATAKSSVIGMWALSPTLFQLLATELPISAPWMSCYYPAAQYSFLSTLKLHCDKHDHFIANSDLLTESSSSSTLAFNSQSGKHFEVILNILIKILEADSGTDVLALVTRWTKDVVESIQRSGSTIVFRLPIFYRLVSAFLIGRRSLIRVDFINCLEAIVKHGQRWFQAEMFQKQMRAIVRLVSETTDKSLLWHLNHLPVLELLKMNFADMKSITRRHVSADWLNASANFDGLSFKSIIDFLLYDVAMTDEEDGTCPWTDRLMMMYVNCVQKAGRDNGKLTPSYLWHFVIWQTGLFCVNSRLKTSLGKPQETFLAIEGELKALANEVVKMETQPSHAASLKPPKFSTWFRVQLFLNFVEILEKTMYNAYEGTAFAMPTASKPVKAFFRTNKATCLEWLNRIRIAVMTVALHNGNYCMVVLLGCNALRDLEAPGSKGAMSTISERIVLLICKAMLALKSSSSLSGLYAWSKKYLGLKLPWIRIAADQAAERYELACKEYDAFLTSSPRPEKQESDDGDATATNNISSGVTKFCTDALIECYASLNDYAAAQQWLNKMAADKKEFSVGFDLPLISVQDQLANGNLEQARSLWQERGATLGPTLLWGMADCHDYFGTKCLDAALQKEDGGRSVIIKKTLDELNEFQWMNICSNWPETISKDLEIYRQHFRIINEAEPLLSEANRTSENARNIKLSHLTKLQQQFRVRECIFPKQGNSMANELCLPLSCNARKLSNFAFSSKTLNQYAGLSSEAEIPTYLSTWGAPPDVKKLIVGYHAAKLTFAASGRDTAFTLLCQTVSGFLDSCATTLVQFQPPTATGQSVVDLLVKTLSPAADISRGTKAGSPISSGSAISSITAANPAMIVSKCLATLANWLEQDSSFGQVLLANENSFFIQLVEHELQVTERIVGALDTDCVVGSLLALSNQLCPNNSKSEALLADWAYKTARKYIEGSSREEHVKLPPEEVAIIEAACQEESDTTKEAALSMLSSLRSDDGAIESEAELRTELESLSLGLSLSADTLIPIWQRANYRVFLLYGVAADSYLKMLHNSDLKPSIAITAALRLLRLLVKHFSDLRHFMSGDFASIHAKAWKDIIPQLFARLNHPSPTIRNVISATLCQIAESHPEMVAFPAVVGAMSGGVSKHHQDATQDLFAATNLDEPLSENGENLLDLGSRADETTVDDSVMNDAYSVVVNALRAKNAAMVDDIKLFIGELQRITLLREEIWLMALSHMEPEVTKRLAHLQQDIQATETHTSLSDADKEVIIAEKRDIMSKMIFQTLTDLYEATSSEPQSENERHFFATFCPIIRSALEKLSNSRRPEEIWAPFAKLLHTLYSRTKPTLNMNDISPVLADLRASRIPMPGITQADKQISIESICVEVTVLPTKTRPKKLRFMGSDGNRYTYLFKGLEDLHLDERMMQFLGVCNTMFDSTKSLEKCNYSAKNYSVTPLGHRSGLIQWVENATPVFSLYKRWQLREASLNPGQTMVTRPSDLFRKKLEPLLQRRNIYDLQNRQKWPHSVLREVLTELIAETPRDLLQKEFWCLSDDADGWWRVTQNFARSAAVMSVIGYLIGLGDRHLDNLLVDLRAGELVHIDYNVCFEKGVHLRVPERVPFRMTPNLRTALGPTGVEGTFRLSCEEILRFLRQGGEALLTLLEAFVYDPLVDWTTPHETGMANFLGHNVLFTVYGSSRLQKYAELGYQLAYRLFEVRVREIATLWLENKETMLAVLRMYYDQQHGTLPEVSDSATIEAERHKVLADHHMMMLGIRGLIKSLAKYEESNSANERPFTDYILAYKAFSESLTTFLKPSLPAEGEKMAVSLDEISEFIHSIYDGLLSLATRSHRTDGSGDRGNLNNNGDQKPLRGLGFLAVTPRKQTNRHRRREGRNVHAINVWRRVKMKLEGREPDAAKRSTIAEQVDYIIRESTSVDNLALMYEGWTAWV